MFGQRRWSGALHAEQAARLARRLWWERAIFAALVVGAWFLRGAFESPQAIGIYDGNKLLAVATDRGQAEEAVQLAQERLAAPNLQLDIKRLSPPPAGQDAGSCVLAIVSNLKAPPSDVGASSAAAPKAGQEESAAGPVPWDYKVVQGDTGFGIAAKFKVSYRDLAQANRGKDLSDLQIGEILKIPASSRAVKRQHP